MSLVIDCGEPQPVRNAIIISIAGFEFGKAVHYQCKYGYTTTDPLTIICKLDGTWSQLPSCVSTHSVQEGTA